MIPANTPDGTLVAAKILHSGHIAGERISVLPGTKGRTIGLPDKMGIVSVQFGPRDWYCTLDNLELVSEAPKESQTPNPFAMLSGLTDQEATEIARQWGLEGLFSTRQMLKQVYALGASRAQAQAFQGIQA